MLGCVKCRAIPIVDQEVSAEKHRNAVQPAFRGQPLQGKREDVSGIPHRLRIDRLNPSGIDQRFQHDRVEHDHINALRRVVDVTVPLGANQRYIGFDLGPAAFNDLLIIPGIRQIGKHRIRQSVHPRLRAACRAKDHHQSHDSCENLLHCIPFPMLTSHQRILPKCR